MKRLRIILIGIVLAIAGAVVPFVFAHTGASTIGCTGVTYNYSGFANANGNTVTEVITQNGQTIYNHTFTFNGTTASHVVSVNLSGDNLIEATSSWNTNEEQGNYDSGIVHLVCVTTTVTLPGTTSTTISTTTLPAQTTTLPAQTTTVQKTVTNNVTSTVVSTTTTPATTVTLPTQTVTAPPVTTTVAGPATEITNTTTVAGPEKIVTIAGKTKTRIVVETKVKNHTIYKTRTKTIVVSVRCKPHITPHSNIPHSGFGKG